MDNTAYLLVLHVVNGLGPIRLKLLLDYFQDPQRVWEASEKELIEIGLPKNALESLLETRKKLEPEKYLEQIKKANIKWVSLFEEDYPKLLKEIYDPPIVLFYKGDLKKADQKNIAVVGTRKITGYGKMVTELFTKFLSEAGLTIVSGLARGVDCVAHQMAVKVKGQTIAVLGSGLNNIFPPENISLANQIVNNGLGAVISEFPPESQAFPGNFPARNRIISGLSKAVLVTEAAEDSGSLITAKCALEQGREVFAVPGPITSDFSQGPLTLIKQGARLVTRPEEILEELGIDRIINNELRNKGEERLNQTERQILEFLANEQRQVDEICQNLKIPPAQVSAALVKMEIFGLVKNLGGGIYIKI